MPSRKSSWNHEPSAAGTMSAVTSPTGSKIPVAVGRQPLSPTDHQTNNVQASRIPKLSSGSAKNGTTTPRKDSGGGEAAVAVVSPSRIPVHHFAGSNNVDASPKLSEVQVVRRQSSPKRANSESAPRPQSIDIEDEFTHRIDHRQRQIMMICENNSQPARQQQQPHRKRSVPNAHSQSPSRIPVSTDYALSSEIKKSGSRSSVSSASSPVRKYSAPPHTSSSNATTPGSSRGASPAKSLSQANRNGSLEHLLAKSNGSLNSEPGDDSGEVGSGGRSSSKIPVMKNKIRQSPPKTPPKSVIPTLGWSLASERQERLSPSSQQQQQHQPEVLLQHKYAFKSSGLEPSHLLRGGDPKEKSDEDLDEASDYEAGGGRKKKRYEAYVMTGDRMIQLAKTPANKEFRSKHPRPTLDQIPLLNEESVSVPSSPSAAGTDGENVPTIDGDDYNADVEIRVKMRPNPIERRSLVRTSKSEDQLMLLEQSSPEVEESAGSVHTLLDTSPMVPSKPSYKSSSTSSSSSSSSTTASSNSSSRVQHQPVTAATTTNSSCTPKRSVSSSDTISSNSDGSARKLLLPLEVTANAPNNPQRSAAAVSPDVSTSSLISASEHYNGESLLDNISPQTSSSPETPEWSLMDSYHKKSNGNNHNNGDKIMESVKEQLDDSGSVKDGDDDVNRNRTVISIGNNSILTEEQTVLNSSSRSSSSSQHNRSGSADRMGSFVSASPIKSPPASASTSSGSPIKHFTAFPANGVSHDNPEHRQQIEASPPMLAVSPDARGGGLEGYSSISSEEESDLESLQSYRPPAKVIDIPSAVRLAKRLYLLDGFKKTDVSRHLSRNNDFNHAVAEEYLKFFDFSNLTLDAALKKFVGKFCLTGETQERERVLIHFSKRYLECNPEVTQGPDAWFRSQDSVHTLTCAIMLLNTDLHGDNHLQRKMMCNEFIENLSELNDGLDFPRELLKNIYYAIKHEPIPWSNDDDLLLSPEAAAAAGGSLPGPANSVPNTAGGPVAAAAASAGSALVQPSGKGYSSPVPSDPQSRRQRPEMAEGAGSAARVSTSNIAVGKTGGGINPFLTLPDPQSASDFKKGYVMRKCCYDPNGKKTKLGKRGWKMYFLTLRDMVLYCFKDDKTTRLPGAYEDINSAIRVHHGLAEIASDYNKKQFVFRLYTADQAQYLFQTSDEKELITWIDAINYVVAMFSAPQLPAPCSSNTGRFQRPLMPSSKSSLALADQLVRHERQLLQLRNQIEDHLQNPPPKSAKANQVQAYREKQEFLRFEINRYETYILTLRTRNALDSSTPGAKTSSSATSAIANPSSAASSSGYGSRLAK